MKYLTTIILWLGMCGIAHANTLTPIRYKLNYEGATYSVQFFLFGNESDGKPSHISAIVVSDDKLVDEPTLSLVGSDASSVVSWRGDNFRVPHNLVLLLDQLAGGFVILATRSTETAFADRKSTEDFISEMLSRKAKRKMASRANDVTSLN